jgi:hypothetical protein
MPPSVNALPRRKLHRAADWRPETLPRIGGGGWLGPTGMRDPVDFQAASEPKVRRARIGRRNPLRSRPSSGAGSDSREAPISFRLVNPLFAVFDLPLRPGD